jgi:hypothetical protein
MHKKRREAVAFATTLPPATYLLALPACPACLASRSYQMKRNPTRIVRGARIAVGCWNATPVAALIVSPA